MKQKIAIFISWITIFILTGLIITVFYWLNYPYKTLVLLNQPFEVLTPIIKSGELLIYHVDYCKYTNLSSETTRSFNDGINYYLLMVVSSNPQGCHEIFPSLIVPLLPPGNYYLRTTYQYKVNPIRTITIDASSSAFMIIK